MRNINNQNTDFFQLVYLFKKNCSLCFRNCRSRLIHNNHFGMNRNRFYYFNQLHLSNRKIPHQVFCINFYPYRIQKCLCLFPLFIHINAGKNSLLFDFSSQENVFRNLHIQEYIQFLMNHDNSFIHSSLGTLKLLFIAFKKDFSPICLGNSHQNFHQSRFSGSIFSHKCQDFTTFCIKGNIVQYFYPRIIFTDISHF